MTENGRGSAVDAVRNKFPDAVLGDEGSPGEPVVVIEATKWIKVAQWLSAEEGFSFLSDLCGVDRPQSKPRFEVVYELTDMSARRVLRVKVPVGGDPPQTQSVSSIWPTADWHERETYDMFGIVFEGHPDLRRILMPDEWEGHPLRKDYSMGKVPVEYKHLSPGSGLFPTSDPRPPDRDAGEP